MSKTPVFNDNVLGKIEAKINDFINDGNLPTLKGLTAPIILKHIKTISELIFLYQNDVRVFSVAYSGGKDSTVTLDLVLKALMLIKLIYGKESVSKTTYVLFSDTYMELDPVIKGILSSLKQVQNFCNEHQLNVEVKKVSPELKDRFFSLIIGKGYILPSSNSRRYCSERLKINPQTKAINALLEKEGNFIAITGQRQDESADRKKRMQIQTIDGSFKSHEVSGCSLYAPIEYFKSDNVWNYIYTSSFDWVDAVELGKVYAEATESSDDECRSLLIGSENGGSNPGCGKSGRFGCWICPLHVQKDKTLNALGKHYPYLKDMEDYRNWLVQDAEGIWDFKRDVYIHGKHKMKTYDIENHRKGMMLPGGYTLNFRKLMLIKLMELEVKILPIKGEFLISDEELSYIQQIWIEDGDVDYSVVEICKHRKINVPEKYKETVDAALIMCDKKSYGLHNMKTLYMDSWHTVKGLTRNVCARYYTQMALQLLNTNNDAFKFMNILRNGSEAAQTLFVKFVKTLPLEKMDFIGSHEENYIREEWKEDKIGFMTFIKRYENNDISKPQKNLFGYEGDYGEHFEALDEFQEKGDILNCHKISLKDKMRFFDEW